jgi:hypothetical protein
MLALLLGSVLAVLGLVYVLLPVWRGPAYAASMSATAPDLPPEASAIDALREIEFDQATGKLAPEDYATLKAAYTPLAIAELEARDRVTDAAQHAGNPDSDAMEQLIARARLQRSRACPIHGVRPEHDATFCSDCGQFLGASCSTCGTAVEGNSARFCVGCGGALART